MKKKILEKVCLGTGDLLKDNIENRIKVLKIFYAEGGKLIDTARVYHNGKSLKVLKKLNERFSLIGKPSYLAQDKNITLKKKLQDYKNLSGYNKIDFFITHWPNKNISKKNINNFLSIKKDDSVKYIGIGNPRFEELKKFYSFSNKNLDAIEIEFNIFNYFFQKKIITFCKNNKIKVFGYSPIRWCNFKKLNDSSKKIIKQITKRFKINFKDMSLLFSLYKNVIPIVSIKNLSRYNKMKKLNDLLYKSDLKKLIFKLEQKIRQVENIDPNKIFYLVNNNHIKLENIKLNKNALEMVKKEIKIHKSPLKPVFLKKYRNKYLVLDGKIRCKALYELNSKINSIIL
tara:strand:- start:29773 stop:30801 length:1029 start_codon:yes stop_codon:yes gene_type:complete